MSSAMSADGKQVATGCADGSVRVWDVATAKQIIELRGNVATTKKMAELDWTIAAQTLEQAFQKSEIARIEAQNKALDELLEQGERRHRRDEEGAAGKAEGREARAPTRRPPRRRRWMKSRRRSPKPPTASRMPLSRRSSRTRRTSSSPPTMTETSALAAVSAAESNVKDAEADVKRITDSKAKNAAKPSPPRTRPSTPRRSTQDKATADLAALKQSLTQSDDEADRRVVFRRCAARRAHVRRWHAARLGRRHRHADRRKRRHAAATHDDHCRARWLVHRDESRHADRRQRAALGAGAQARRRRASSPTA